jgi:hypothetical protein
VAWWYAASRRPIGCNYTRGGCSPRLVLIHVMQGSQAGTDSWFHNPAAQASAHFGVAKDGGVIQWVGTGHQAWHACNANSYAIGIETEGFATSPLTAAQVNSCARIFNWAANNHPGIHEWLNTRAPAGSGLSWHGAAAGWCNHPGCPGTLRRRQLDDIVANARRRG